MSQKHDLLNKALIPMFDKPDTLRPVTWLQNSKLLVSSLACDKCADDMVIQRCVVSTDGYSWRCNSCSERKSIRLHSWFSKHPKVLLKNLLKILSTWSCESGGNMHTLAAESSTSRYTLSKIYAALDEMVVKRLHSTVHPTMLGGLGKYVVMDESFGLQPKNNVGARANREKIWIFGLLEANDGRPKPRFFMIKKRDKPTLHAIIVKHVKVGTTVITDGWSGYKGLEELSYPHYTVIHKTNFVNPETGACTNRIESEWAIVKNTIKRMRGVKTVPALYHVLCKHEWLRWEAEEYPGGPLGCILNMLRV